MEGIIWLIDALSNYLEDISYHCHRNLKMLFRNSEDILPQSCDIEFYSLFDVGQSCLLALPLADAAGKAGHLSHIVAVLSRVDHDLSHVL